MSYRVEYQVKTRDRDGASQVSLYVYDTDGTELWYGTTSFSKTDGLNNTVNLPWDSNAGTVSSSATVSWTHTVRKLGDSSNTIAASFNRTTNILEVKTGSTGLFPTAEGEDGTFYDFNEAVNPSTGAAAAWNSGENNSYAQFNVQTGAIADIAHKVEPTPDPGEEPSEPVYVTYPKPSITATRTEALKIFVIASCSNASDGTAPTLAFQRSTSSSFASYTTTNVVNNEGTADEGLDEETVYYYRAVASWGAGIAPTYSDAVSCLTGSAISPPTVTLDDVLSDGSGKAIWRPVTRADGSTTGITYQMKTADDKELETNATSAVTISPTQKTVGGVVYLVYDWTGTDLAGKFIGIKTCVPSNDPDYVSSNWAVNQVPVIEPPADPEDEETPVTIVTNRRELMAIPYMPSVPVEQIGYYDSDLITKEYGDAHYLRSDGEGGAIIPTTSLPWAVYGETADTSTTTVINPSYLKSAIEALDLAYTITEIAVSGDSGADNFGGVTTDIATASADNGLANETYLVPTTKAVYDFVTAPGNLPKAKAGGGATNAGIVYISAANGENGHGLTISGQNDGLLEVNFATFASSDLSSSSVGTSKALYQVVNPGYIYSLVDYLGVAKSATSFSSNDSNQAGYFVKLASGGKIDSSLLPEVSLTRTILDTTARTYGTGSGYTYATRQAAIEALLSNYSSTVEQGDFIIVAPSVTSETSEYTLQGTFAVTESGSPPVKSLVEINTPEWAVTSVNGHTGIITQAELGLVTSIRLPAAATDTNFPSEKAVSTALSNLDSTKLDTSDFETLLEGYYSITTTVAGLADDGGIVIGQNLASIFSDFETSLNLGTASTYGVASSIADNESGLVTGDQVYDYAAPVTHYHGLGDITYTTSGSTRTGYSAGTSITSSSTDGELATALAVYNYTPLITRIKADSTNLFGGTRTSLSDYTSESTEDYYVPTAYAVKEYVDSHAFDVSQIPAASWTAGTSDWTDTGTGIVNLTYLAAALADYDSDLTVASSKVSGIQTVSDPSASSSFGKVVKTLSDWGQIDGSLIPIDEDSIVNVTGALSVSNTWFNTTGDNRYLKKSDAPTQYVKMTNTGAGAWTTGVSYEVGDLVYATDGKLWRCIQANTSTANPLGNGPEGAGNIGNGDNYVYWVPAKLAVDKRYETTITGDGNSTEFVVTHNLGTRFVQVTLVDADGDEVYPAVRFISTSQVQIGFGNPPAGGQTPDVYSVVVRA